MEYQSLSGVNIITPFVIHHRIDSAWMDPELRKWSQQQKSVPWVAIAAQVPVSSGSPEILYFLADLCRSWIQRS